MGRTIRQLAAPALRQRRTCGCDERMPAGCERVGRRNSRSCNGPGTAAVFTTLAALLLWPWRSESAFESPLVAKLIGRLRECAADDRRIQLKRVDELQLDRFARAFHRGHRRSTVEL